MEKERNLLSESEIQQIANEAENIVSRRTLEIIESVLFDNKIVVDLDNISDLNKVKALVKLFESRVRDLKVFAEYKTMIFINLVLSKLLNRVHELDAMGVDDLINIASRLISRLPFQNKKIDFKEESEEIKELESLIKDVLGESK